MNKNAMTEKVNHETAARPFSIHHTVVGGENTNALYLHCHAEAEFFYLEEGEITFTVGDHSFLLAAGEAVFIPPDLPHNACKEPGKACDYSAVVFSLEWLFGYFGGEGNSYHRFLMKNRQECIQVFRAGCGQKEKQKGREGACLEAKSEGPMEGHIETDSEETMEADLDMFSKFDSREMLGRLARFRNYMDLPIQSYEMRLLGELMISIQEIYNAVSGRMRYNEKTDVSREGIQRGIDYIQKHYDKEIALAELVECSGYSESHFCHRFKSVTGYTPFAYLNRLRVSKAAELLVISDVKITEIAVECGFENISYFNRVFRKEMGMTPGSYRRSGRRHREESVAGQYRVASKTV